MRKIYPASSLLTGLILFSGIFAMLFLNKETLFGIDKITQNDYQRYLNGKIHLIEQIKQDSDQLCKQHKQETVVFHHNPISFSFHCELKSFFLRGKPTKEKFIFIDEIDEWLDIKNHQTEIYAIHTLAELPPSSEQDPKIVITLNNIDERLTHDFYGIIITEHLFNFTDKKIYGTIYSTYKGNDPNRRNLSYKRNVIEGIENKLAVWQYLPHSKSVLHHE